LETVSRASGPIAERRVAGSVEGISLDAHPGNQEPHPNVVGLSCCSAIPNTLPPILAQPSPRDGDGLPRGPLRLHCVRTIILWDGHSGNRAHLGCNLGDGAITWNIGPFESQATFNPVPAYAPNSASQLAQSPRRHRPGRPTP
jgi:hypothetical protein